MVKYFLDTKNKDNIYVLVRKVVHNLVFCLKKGLICIMYRMMLFLFFKSRIREIYTINLEG